MLALKLPPASGSTTYVTNGDLTKFERNVRHWTNDHDGRVMGLAART